MKHVIAGLAAALLVAPAAAQDSSGPSDIVEHFVAADISDILSNIGVSNSVQRLANGDAVVAAQTATGFRFLGIFYGCDEADRDKCTGLQLRASWTRLEGFDKAAVHDFGANYPFAKTFVSGDSAILSRYLTADYGIAKGNVAINAGVFLSFADRFTSYLSSVPPMERSVETSASADLATAFTLNASSGVGHESFSVGALTDMTNKMDASGSKIAN